MSTRHRAVTVNESLSDDTHTLAHTLIHAHMRVSLTARVNGVTKSRRNPLKDSGSELLGSP